MSRQFCVIHDGEAVKTIVGKNSTVVNDQTLENNLPGNPTGSSSDIFRLGSAGQWQTTSGQLCVIDDGEAVETVMTRLKRQAK